MGFRKRARRPFLPARFRAGPTPAQAGQSVAKAEADAAWRAAYERDRADREQAREAARPVPQVRCAWCKTAGPADAPCPHCGAPRQDGAGAGPGPERSPRAARPAPEQRAPRYVSEDDPHRIASQAAYEAYVRDHPRGQTS
jgi:hypothetical protein